MIFNVQQFTSPLSTKIGKQFFYYRQQFLKFGKVFHFEIQTLIPQRKLANMAVFVLTIHSQKFLNTSFNTYDHLCMCFQIWDRFSP